MENGAFRIIILNTTSALMEMAGLVHKATVDLGKNGV